MTATAPAEFSCSNRKLGDPQVVSVVTAPDVFHPTSTTVLLLRAARRALADGPPPRTVLDLGCGSGIVGVVLAKLLPPITHVCASDLSAAAVRLARHNAARNGVAVDCRRGSLFEPWPGERFDMIVDDVAGGLEPVAPASRGDPPGGAGGARQGGTRWVPAVLERGPKLLAPGGRAGVPRVTVF